jgi:hypothetical protein
VFPPCGCCRLCSFCVFICVNCFRNQVCDPAVLSFPFIVNNLYYMRLSPVLNKVFWFIYQFVTFCHWCVNNLVFSFRCIQCWICNEFSDETRNQLWSKGNLENVSLLSLREYSTKIHYLIISWCFSFAHQNKWKWC